MITRANEQKRLFSVPHKPDHESRKLVSGQVEEEPVWTGRGAAATGLILALWYIISEFLLYPVTLVSANK